MLRQRCSVRLRPTLVTTPALLLAALGCAPPARSPSARAPDASFGVRTPNTALGFLLELTAEARAVGATEPVWVTYYLRNTSDVPRAVELQPLSLRFDVIAPSGRAAPYDEWVEPPLLGSQADLTLPVDGFVGRRVNLRCSTAWLGRVVAAGMNGCAWGFEFREPGEYRVVLHYRAGRGREGSAALELDSDTVRVEIRRP